MKKYVAAYAASAGLDPAAEDELHQGLASMEIAGLEQPILGDGSLHLDEARLIERIRPEWSIVLTLLPGTMDHLKNDPNFGLASADEDGRRRALDFAEAALRKIVALDAVLGRRAVRAVLLHSAPALARGGKSSLEGFARSLTALRGLDWRGASLLVEHCDTTVAGRAPDKGFLRIEDDALAVKLSSGPTPAALAINWGRSALETRSAEGPLEHVARAVQSGLMGGLFFSGVTPGHAEYDAWRDSHAPFSTTTPESLLTPAAAKAALALAPDCPIVGLKLQTKPPSLSVAARLAVIQDGLDALK